MHTSPHNNQPAVTKPGAGRWLLAAVLLLGALPGPVYGVLGENLDSLRKRFGPPAPELQRRKNVATWFIETEESERLMYTVTFDGAGRSVAEGLRPVGRAILKERMARKFIDSQLEPHLGAKTTRAAKPGEKYTFAGREHVCAANEAVIVDEANDFLIVAISGPLPSLLAVRSEMIRSVD